MRHRRNHQHKTGKTQTKLFNHWLNWTSSEHTHVGPTAIKLAAVVFATSKASECSALGHSCPLQSLMYHQRQLWSSLSARSHPMQVWHSYTQVSRATLTLVTEVWTQSPTQAPRQAGTGKEAGRHRAPLRSLKASLQFLSWRYHSKTRI